MMVSPQGRWVVHGEPVQVHPDADYAEVKAAPNTAPTMIAVIMSRMTLFIG